MRAVSVTSPVAPARRSAVPSRGAVERPLTPRLDQESRRWLADLRGQGAVHDEAVGRLHELLLKAARFEVARRSRGLAHLRDELDDIAMEAADDALMSVLRRLGDYRGLSRFTTWA